MAGSISQNPAEMTVGEYISENLNRMDPKSPEYTALKNFYDTQVKGQSLANKYTGNVGSLFKDMFEKASKIKFGELHGQQNQTQMQEPEVVKEARQSFVNSDRNKVSNEDLSRQVNNIQKYDQGTAAGQGRNTEAAKQAQEAIRDSRKVVNENKQDGVADIPVTDDRSDEWYKDGTGEGNEGTPNEGTPQVADTTGNPSETTTPEEKEANSNGLLLADILMTGVKNALHYRPAFRTAYGEDIEGRDFGNEKSLAMKLAEENMKRGLERANSRKDYESQQQAEQEATKQKGQDAKYLAAQQALTRNTSPTTTTKSYQEAHGNILGNTSKAGNETNVEWADPNALSQSVQTSR